MELEKLQYPIGRFTPKTEIDATERKNLIEQIAALPALLRAEVENLSEKQLETPYRPDGWTVRQVIHHLPDSHLNSYVRCKLALTEDNPIIRPYDQSAWAETVDARSAPIAPSLELLTGLHARWAPWLGTLTEDQWKRTFQHPEMGQIGLEWNLQLYAWHGRHHLGHIQNVTKERTPA